MHALDRQLRDRLDEFNRRTHGQHRDDDTRLLLEVIAKQQERIEELSEQLDEAWDE